MKITPAWEKLTCREEGTGRKHQGLQQAWNQITYWMMTNNTANSYVNMHRKDNVNLNIELSIDQ